LEWKHIYLSEGLLVELCGEDFAVVLGVVGNKVLWRGSDAF
jgi:hypothetical protein